MTCRFFRYERKTKRWSFPPSSRGKIRFVFTFGQTLEKIIGRSGRRCGEQRVDQPVSDPIGISHAGQSMFGARIDNEKAEGDENRSDRGDLIARQSNIVNDQRTIYRNTMPEQR